MYCVLPEISTPLTQGVSWFEQLCPSHWKFQFYFPLIILAFDTPSPVEFPITLLRVGMDIL